MTYVIFAIVGFIAGVLCAGYVVAAIGGLKTELALARVSGAQDVTKLHQRADELEDRLYEIANKIRNNLP